MNNFDTKNELEFILRKIFSSQIKLDKTISQKNFKKWDSLNHVRIFIEIENKLNIKFSSDEINSLNDSDQILKKINSKLKNK